MHWRGMLFALVVLGVPAGAQTTPSPTPASDAPPLAAEMRPFEARAAQLFSPSFITDPGSALNVRCDRVLLICQAVSAIIIVASLLVRIRSEQTQMEGVAATLIKVAFIATIPLWRTVVLDTVDSAASAVGYQSVAAGDRPESVTGDLWGLLRAWVPAGSPNLDAAVSQDVTPPRSGHEQDWAANAWNWARGVGAEDVTLFQSVWQATSGGLRGLLLFGSCAGMVCALSLTIMLTYLSEIARYLLFFGGCAFLPIFIAGLGVDSLRGPAMKAILAVVTIAFWPIGWALANIVTHSLAGAANLWMNDVATTATAAAGATPVPFGVAAPYVAWGALFWFVGVTLAICCWAFVMVFYAPVLITRLVSAGASIAGRISHPAGTPALTQERNARGGTTIRRDVAISVRPNPSTQRVLAGAAPAPVARTGAPTARGASSSVRLRDGPASSPTLNFNRPGRNGARTT